MNRRRLEVEAWRDAMLAVAGTLDRTIGGPSVDLADRRQPPPHALRRRQPARPRPAAAAVRLPRPEHHQRRAAGDDGAAAAAVRAQQRVHGRATPRRWPARLREATRATTRRRIRVARSCCSTAGRRPTAKCSSGWQFVATTAELPDSAHAWEQYAQVLLSANEFVFVD